jgi:hypothetical protein
MTECPAFLFIFLPGSISEQRGLRRSPSPALREPDLSRPPYRSEHLQNHRPNAPALIKSTIPRRAGRGGVGGGRRLAAGWGGRTQTQPTPKSFGKPQSATLTAVGPSGPREGKNQRCLQQKALLPRPRSRLEVLFCFFDRGGELHKSTPLSKRELNAHLQFQGSGVPPGLCQLRRSSPVAER